jgi:putative endonuclease
MTSGARHLLLLTTLTPCSDSRHGSVVSKSRRIYTGMTNNLYERVLQHKTGEIEGFTKRYKINRLVYYEEYKYVYNTIRREKQIKGLDRAKRVALIESMNPTWEDLADDWGKPIKPLKPRVHDLKAEASTSLRSASS